MRGMRRKDREMEKASALALFQSTSWMTLSMIGAEEGGQPYAIPLSFVMVGEELFFHGARAGYKRECLLSDNRVCVTAVAFAETDAPAFSVAYQSVVAKGRAFLVEDESLKREALRKLCEKYTPSEMDRFDSSWEHHRLATEIWRIELLEWSGKQRKFE
ncbi:MAG: pyridoxamine 5'-phosphate oxidase family protein [Sphaerochaeta sp.]|uniref:pyridoxamine 5'-phosphate oxidase family protein n=1 Tax=Sphaerochaeta sp. TaxID=1972642 RepID=UPI002A2BFA3F|nr:pyridoxamine 5'-phosphate oxidase family protein [Sphaerochaeta sp.]